MERKQTILHELTKITQYPLTKIQFDRVIEPYVNRQYEFFSFINDIYEGVITLTDFIMVDPSKGPDTEYFAGFSLKVNLDYNKFKEKLYIFSRHDEVKIIGRLTNVLYSPRELWFELISIDQTGSNLFKMS